MGLFIGQQNYFNVGNAFMHSAILVGVFRRGNKPPVLLGEEKTSRATIKRGEASAKPQRNIGKN